MRWVDMHCDLPYELAVRRRRGEWDVVRNLFLRDFQDSGLGLLVVSLFVDDLSVPRALEEALFQLQCLLEEEREAEGAFVLVKDLKQLERCLSGGPMGLVLSMEGAEPLEGSEELLGFFRYHGLGSLGLTWSRRNRFADGTDLKGSVRSPGGLSSRGMALARSAAEVGVALDVSHLNDPGVDDLLHMGVFLWASHSNCRSLCSHPRNLEDRHIEAIGRLGGVVGFNAHGSFVGFDDPVEGMYRHITRVVDLAGEEACALGLDLCDRFESFYQGVRKDLFMSHREARDALDALKARLGSRLMGKLLWENPLRVIERALKGSPSAAPPLP
ncbi:MAG: membrane dipeptidase [Thermanaerothrix sp.]|nr:membrane dipeptidase [Thermanaerothrix sp.]